jgi:hypothetical protein
VLSCAPFQQHFTFIHVRFNLARSAYRNVLPSRIEQFLYKKACRSFPVSCQHMSGEYSTGLFRFKPSSGARASFQPPGVLMHLPPFHGHAGATVSTI